MTSQAPTQGPTDAGLTARVLSSEWQPIETAPKDSKARLVWCPENMCIYCVSWRDGFDCEYDDEKGWTVFGGGWRDVIQRPTHWMPLPTPPTNLKGAA